MYTIVSYFVFFNGVGVCVCGVPFLYFLNFKFILYVCFLKRMKAWDSMDGEVGRIRDQIGRENNIRIYCMKNNYIQ